MKRVSERTLDDELRLELSESQEDYLKQIFLLGGDGDRVSTQALARRLTVKPASVTEMVGRLAQLGLVEHAPYHGVRLTDAGRRVAAHLHFRRSYSFLRRPATPVVDARRVHRYGTGHDGGGAFPSL